MQGCEPLSADRSPLAVGHDRLRSGPLRFHPHPSTLILVLLLPCLLVGQITFQRTYGGPGEDRAYSAQQTSDGGYVIAGRTESYGAGVCDIWLVKTDSIGDTMWTRTYGGPEYEEAQSVQQTTDGGYIIAGFTDDNADVWLVKTDANGDSVWTRAYGGGGGDFGYSVRQTADRGYVVAGRTWSFGAGGDIYLIKTNALGDTMWTRTYGGEDGEQGFAVQQTTDGGYIVAGITESFNSVYFDMYLVRTDSTGDTVWTRTLGGRRYDEGSSVLQTADGGFIVAGVTNSFTTGDYDAWLVRTDPNGETTWTRTFGGQEWDDGRSVLQTPDGGFVVAGYTGSHGAGGTDVWLIKTDSSGETEWTNTYGDAGWEYGHSVWQTEDLGYVVGGVERPTNTVPFDFHLIKTDSLGRVGIAETPKPERKEPRWPSVLTRAQRQTELLADPSLSLFDASGREVLRPNTNPRGIYFVRRPTADSRQLTASRKVLLTN